MVTLNQIENEKEYENFGANNIPWAFNTRTYKLILYYVRRFIR